MKTLQSELDLKYQRALDLLRETGGAIIAFSAGVDSTLLLHMAHQALGERSVALTTVSPSLPERERAEAVSLAKMIGVKHLLVESGELEREGFAENTSERCYFCKSELFDHCFEAAARLGLPAVVYGATVDDLGDHRPGMRSARERGASAPLLEAGLKKAEIRELSERLKLPTWDKPAMACLSSRFPTGTRITKQRLTRIEQAEEVLKRRGFRELRVRFHDEIARIELGESEWSRLGDPRLRAEVAGELKALGFRFVSLDLEGFRSGRLNEGGDARSEP